MGKADVVVDTNVPLVANGKAEQAGLKCEDACVRKLRQVQAGRRTLVDDKWLIIEEYRRRSQPLPGSPGVGDAFFKWLWENQANPQHCRIVPITVHSDRGFAEFPDDPRLNSFDLSDRKFVAVALASGAGPHVLNAAETDWWDHRQALEENGVDVVFLCPELMEREALTGTKRNAPTRGTSGQRCYRWGGMGTVHDDLLNRQNDARGILVAGEKKRRPPQGGTSAQRYSRWGGMGTVHDDLLNRQNDARGILVVGEKKRRPPQGGTSGQRYSRWGGVDTVQYALLNCQDCPYPF